MSFHLDECGLVVGFTTDLSEILYCGHSFLCVFELGGDPEGSAADKLIVLDVDDPAGYVSVDDVQSQIECFRPEAECKVNLY